MWDVEVTDEFLHWWHRLTIDQQESLTDRVELLSWPNADPTWAGRWSTASTPPDTRT